MEDNFYEVQTTKCTKTLYQPGTIRPVILPVSILSQAAVWLDWGELANLEFNNKGSNIPS